MVMIGLGFVACDVNIANMTKYLYRQFNTSKLCKHAEGPIWNMVML